MMNENYLLDMRSMAGPSAMQTAYNGQVGMYADHKYTPPNMMHPSTHQISYVHPLINLTPKPEPPPPPLPPPPPPSSKKSAKGSRPRNKSGVAKIVKRKPSPQPPPIVNHSQEIIVQQVAQDNKVHKKKGRKRKYAQSRQERKENMYKNLPYVNSRNQEVQPKQFEDYDCKCPLKCRKKVSPEARKREFDAFYNLGSYTAQNVFLLERIKEINKKIKSEKLESDDGKKRKNIRDKGKAVKKKGNKKNSKKEKSDSDSDEPTSEISVQDKSFSENPKNLTLIISSEKQCSNDFSSDQFSEASLDKKCFGDCSKESCPDRIEPVKCFYDNSTELVQEQKCFYEFSKVQEMIPNQKYIYQYQKDLNINDNSKPNQLQQLHSLQQEVLHIEFINQPSLDDTINQQMTNQCQQVTNQCQPVTNQCQQMANQCQVTNQCQQVLNQCHQITNQCQQVANQCQVTNQCLQLSNVCQVTNISNMCQQIQDPNMCHQISNQCQQVIINQCQQVSDPCHQVTHLNQQMDNSCQQVVMNSCQQLQVLQPNQENSNSNQQSMENNQLSAGKRKRRPFKTPERLFTRIYHLNKVRVCREMFVKTLKISSGRVNTVLKKSRSGDGLYRKSGNQGGHNKLTEEQKTGVYNHINHLLHFMAFNNTPGAPESKNQNKSPFPPGITLKSMYKMYQGTRDNFKPVSFTSYSRIFYKEFNPKTKVSSSASNTSSAPAPVPVQEKKYNMTTNNYNIQTFQTVPPPVKQYPDNMYRPPDTTVQMYANSLPVNHNNSVVQPSVSITVNKPPKRKGRKRKYGDLTRQERKYNMYRNLPYVNSRNKEVLPKQFEDFDCHCPLKCRQRVSPKERMREFDGYYNLGSYIAQNMYLLDRVEESLKKRCYIKNRPAKRERNFSRIYKLSKVRVCREMFLKTLKISSVRINTVLNKKRSGEELTYKRGLNQGGLNKITEEQKNGIVEHINCIIRTLSINQQPTSEGDFVFPQEYTFKRMYEIYKENNRMGKSVSFSTYRRVFNEKFDFRVKTG